MIIVTEKRSTAKSSLYKATRTGREVNYTKLFSRLLDQGEDPDTARDLIEEAWANADVQDPNEIESTVFNEETRELFKFFKWHKDLKGAMSMFCWTDLEKQVYTHSASLLDSAAAVEPAGMEQTLFAWMLVTYNELVRTKKLSFYYAVLGGKKVFPTLSHYWKNWAEPVWREDSEFQLNKMPVSITADPEEPCFFFFNPDTLKKGKYPNWRGWLNIVPEPLRLVLKAWVYSIFMPGNKGRQALWLHDNGFTGKTSVINAISQYLGKDASGAISSGSMKTNFAFETVYGKRFISYGDCNEPNLIKSPKIHSILGNDIVIIDQKNMRPFPARLHAKILVASNIAPYINTNAHNERTRILYIPLLEPTEDQLKKYCRLDKDGNIMRYDNGSPQVIGGNLQEELFQEMEPFLYSCRKCYEVMCSTGQDIVVTQAHLDLMEHHCISEEELTFRNICAQMFVFKEESSLPLRIMQQAFNVATSGTPYRSGGISDFSRFKKYVLDRRSVTIEKSKGKNKIRTQMCYGVKINPESGMLDRLHNVLTVTEMDLYMGED